MRDKYKYKTKVGTLPSTVLSATSLGKEL